MRPFFVGRDAELAALLRLWEGGGRLVSVTGPAGVGKSSLLDAFEAAIDVGEVRVLRVDASELPDAASLLDSIRHALKMSLPPESVVPRGLATALDAQPTLLILDNLEHLVGAMTPLLTQWLENAPELQLLVASRVSLRDPVEQRLALDPLNDLQTERAIFLHHLRGRAPVIAQSLEDDRKLDDLLALLHGLPLALELAAARCALQSVEEVQARLRQGYAIDSASGESPRRSLRASMEASYELLPDEARTALVQLCVFADGFEARDAEGVLDVDGDPLALLERLYDHSLIVR
ncbi:MAG: ATP-binding protein [Myxococcota bacterium]